MQGSELSVTQNKVGDDRKHAGCRNVNSYEQNRTHTSKRVAFECLLCRVACVAEIRSVRMFDSPLHAEISGSPSSSNRTI
jgi:hypothetical protein